MRVWSVARQVGEAGWSPDWLGAPHGHLWRASRVNEDANHVPDRLTMSMRRLLSGLQRRASARARKLFVGQVDVEADGRQLRAHRREPIDANLLDFWPRRRTMEGARWMAACEQCIPARRAQRPRRVAVSESDAAGTERVGAGREPFAKIVRLQVVSHHEHYVWQSTARHWHV